MWKPLFLASVRAYNVISAREYSVFLDHELTYNSVGIYKLELKITGRDNDGPCSKRYDRVRVGPYTQFSDDAKCLLSRDLSIFKLVSVIHIL